MPTVTYERREALSARSAHIDRRCRQIAFASITGRFHVAVGQDSTTHCGSGITWMTSHHVRDVTLLTWAKRYIIGRRLRHSWTWHGIRPSPSPRPLYKPSHYIKTAAHGEILPSSHSLSATK